MMPQAASPPTATATAARNKTYDYDALDRLTADISRDRQPDLSLTTPTATAPASALDTRCPTAYSIEAPQQPPAQRSQGPTAKTYTYDASGNSHWRRPRQLHLQQPQAVLTQASHRDHDGALHPQRLAASASSKTGPALKQRPAPLCLRPVRPPDRRIRPALALARQETVWLGRHPGRRGQTRPDPSASPTGLRFIQADHLEHAARDPRTAPTPWSGAGTATPSARASPMKTRTVTARLLNITSAFRGSIMTGRRGCITITSEIMSRGQDGILRAIRLG